MRLLIPPQAQITSAALRQLNNPETDQREGWTQDFTRLNSLPPQVNPHVTLQDK